MLLRSGCPLRLTARLRTPCAAGLFGPTVTWRTVNLGTLLRSQQSCGLKKRPLVQQTSSGPAATCAADLFGPSSHLENRERVAPAEPTVSGGLRDFLPEAITLPSLGDDRPLLDFQKTSLVPSHWTGQYVWVPEAFTRPVTLDRPGRLVIVQTARSLYWLGQLAAVSFPRLCLSCTSF